MTRDAFRLIAPAFRFVGADIVRTRRGYLLGTLTLIILGEIAIGLRIRATQADSISYGPLLILGLWVVAAPFCKSIVDEDVRLGFAALWLQKPIRVLDFYSSRLIALLAWALIASLSICLAMIPGLIAASAPLIQFLNPIIGLAWIPPTLVILSFLGSAAGARNSGLFAYGMLFAGFTLEGLSDALPLGRLTSFLKPLFPPAHMAVEASQSLQHGAYAEALGKIAPVLGYGMVVAAVGLALALRVPKRLAAAE